MSAKSPDAEANAALGRALRQATDDLYAGPFDGFVERRKELVARLREAGDAAGARQLAAANRPTRTAWALNQVARGQPALIAGVVGAREVATAAQKKGDADAIRESARRYREAVGDAIRAARSALEADGISLSAAQARRMGETLQALATDDAEREKLTAGRLTRDVAVDDPFAGLEAGPTRHAPARHAEVEAPAREATPPKRAGEEGARAREAERTAERTREAERVRREREKALDDARARVAAVERAVGEARSTAADAKRALTQAQNEADRAKAAVETLARDLAAAREHLKGLLAAHRG